MADKQILTIELAEVTIVFGQLSGYLVHLASLIGRSYNEKDLLSSGRSFSQHTGQSSILSAITFESFAEITIP
jgi:hypothetical protein